MNLIERAKEFATNAHKGQLRRDGMTPYIEHPKAVVKILLEDKINDNNIIASAWLHDVIEDCGATKEEIEREFNSEIVRIVSALSRNCSRSEYNKKIINSDFAIQVIKIADTISNCHDLFEGIGEKTIKRKIYDCKNVYFEMSKKISPKLYKELYKAIEPWMKKYN